jgi:hypothetical protein
MTKHLRIQKGMGQLRFANIEEEIELAKKSVRRWWWEYLRLSKDYWLICMTSSSRANARTIDDRYKTLYKHFGNVHDCNFETWYERDGSAIFQEREAFDKVIEVDDELSNITQERENRILLDVPLSLSVKAINKQIGRILKQHETHRPANLLENSSSLYPINPIKFRLLSLKRMHEVWCLHRELIAKPIAIGEVPTTYVLRADLFRVGAVLNISPENARQTNEIDERHKRLNRMRATVGRYLSKANLLISNVERGVFPAYDKKEQNRNIFSERQKAIHKELDVEWWKLDLTSSLSVNRVEEARRIAYNWYGSN